jgi:small subunit ribosomal protein S4
MYKVKNRRHRPFYKKFISLRTNVQYRRRLSLLKFKKQKWEKLISYLKRSMNRSRYNFRAYDLNKRNLPRYYNPFKRKYKNTLQNKKRISLFYGNLLVKYLKKQVSLVIRNRIKIIKNFINLNNFFLSLLEKRLDVILYRAHFARSIRNAQQLILHKHIKVNGLTVTNKSFSLKQGDIVQINENAKQLIDDNIGRSHIWPIPPKYLQVNFKTFDIIINGNIEFYNLSTLFPFLPNIFLLLRFSR